MKSGSSKTSFGEDQKSVTTWTELSQNIFGNEVTDLEKKNPKKTKNL